MQLISTFNRLLSNRLIWAFLTIFIVISFVLAGAITGCEAPRRNSIAVGTLAERPVTATEFTDARKFVSQSMLENARRRGVTQTPTATDRDIWRWLSQQQQADQLGLTVTAGEIRERLLSVTDFYDDDGIFDANRYSLIVTRVFRMTPRLYEEYLRQDILRGKLQEFARNMVWTSPAEAREIAADYADHFEVQYARFPESDFTTIAALSNEQVRAYFRTNVEQFRMPELIQVHYLAVAISNQLAAVSIEAGEAEFFYNENLNRYMVEPEGTNTVRSTLPFEFVKTNIIQEVRWNKARTYTRRFADRILEDIAQQRTPVVDLVAIGAEYDVPVYTSGFFAADDDIPGIDADRFASAAFSLDPDHRSFSYPVVGEKYVYILARPEKRESRLPRFDEVAGAIEPLAAEDAAMQAFRNNIIKMRDRVTQQLAEGVTFSETIEDYGVAIQTTGVFSAFSINEQMQTLGEMPKFPIDVAATAIRLQQGEVSDPLFLANEALLIYVRNREPGPIDVFMQETKRATMSLQQMRWQQTALDWSESLATTSMRSDGTENESDRKVDRD